MLLEIIEERRNEVLGQPVPATFRPSSGIAGCARLPKVGWSLLELCNFSHSIHSLLLLITYMAESAP
jgi:hypothetical protein